MEQLVQPDRAAVRRGQPAARQPGPGQPVGSAHAGRLAVRGGRRVSDRQPRITAGEPGLDRGQRGDQPVHRPAQRAPGRGMGRVQPELPAGQSQDRGTHRMALSVVGVEQPVRCPATHGPGQFPAQVDRVLEARVHPLCARGRVRVRGVPGQEDPPVTVRRGLAALAAVPPGPAHIAGTEVLAGDGEQAAPHLLEGDRLGHRHPRTRVVVQHHPARAVPEREDQQHAPIGQVAVGVRHRQAVEEQIGQEHRARVGGAWERQARGLPGEAADPVAADQVGGPIDPAVRRHPHLIGVLLDAGDPG